MILVGEIRDSETAQTASEAALTGHLVFSSLHANTALSAVVRLRELGVEGYLISATLRGVLAQRLVRRLCPKCARSEAPTPEEAALFRLHNAPVPAQIHHAQGCEACDGTGFSGRVGVYDILEIDEKMRAAIDADASEVRLREAAGERPSLMQSALALVADGQTSLADWLSTRARRTMANVVCIWVDAYRRFKTTCGLASRLSSMTMRIPSRSVSSRSAEMPSNFLILNMLGNGAQSAGLY